MMMHSSALAAYVQYTLAESFIPAAARSSADARPDGSIVETDTPARLDRTGFSVHTSHSSDGCPRAIELFPSVE
jgi:hypothetical protein